MVTITAEEVADRFVDGWIARFGVPTTVTTDQGRQFESDLFKRLMNVGATDRRRTTSYHPQANGMIERFHRQLKAALMCHSDTWHRALPIVLLGIRSALKEDLECSSAELVYGEPLRLPGEFLIASPPNTTDNVNDFVTVLRAKMANLRPIPASRHTRPTSFIFKDLQDASHVLLRDDTVRRALQPPYTGPYKVISRTDKLLDIDMAGKRVTVTIDRVKPAYIAPDPESDLSRVAAPQQTAAPAPAVQAPSAPAPFATAQPTVPPVAQQPVTTRSGRTVRFKDRLDL